MELRYLQEMQRRRRSWNIERADMEAMRARVTPAQDAEISGALGIEPGSINLAPLVLKEF
jgi:hypothetical protein